MEALLHDEDGTWRYRDIPYPAEPYLQLSRCSSQGRGANTCARKVKHSFYRLDTDPRSRHLRCPVYEFTHSVVNDIWIPVESANVAGVSRESTSVEG